jgi:hypothetical protein
VRVFRGRCRRFSELGGIHEDVHRPGIVSHGFRPKLHFHFARFAADLFPCRRVNGRRIPRLSPLKMKILMDAGS